ncbi:MAG: TIGR03013 family PEP-CTERM/XrtA system glycosyltransferase [Pyrinomonadaceae bacterium]|nr:TIGR03013 family PEP-CTERM/XrtA system glycosyltransferase [Pyrinomonadaceae bacterium]MCX7638932.1 TIGR03013 family PEP-CTERM/XrtA system glycosyltransferase [Pyrinomonadaceae bacterium]MDW8304931.1 TIGR03013 family PEP-CTERM/XrtA system glycosyltransferase [Acidobacteriota bacterium]
MKASHLRHRIIALLIFDAIITYSSLILALILRLGVEGTKYQLNERNGWLKASFITLVCILSMHLYDLYEYTVIKNRLELLLRLVQAVGVAWIFLAIFFYFVPEMMIGRGTSIYAVLLVITFLSIWRVSLHFLLGHPDIGERVAIVGTNKPAIDTAEAILHRPDAGYRLIGLIAENHSVKLEKKPEIKILGSVDELYQIVKRENIDRLVIAVLERRGNFPTETLLKLSLAGEVLIEECASFYERITGQVHLDMLRPSWLIFNSRRKQTRFSYILREVVHRALALIGLIVSLPIAIITAILIKIESEGDIFYRQERTGKNGKTFQLIKFRSMRVDAEKNGQPVWAQPNDDRVTRVGKIIRKARIDEIPQFWNILKGEMSFVGPRPERPQFVEQLAKQIPFYEHRHLTQPGLTGWAQINYPYGSSVEDAKKKLQYDLYYIKNQSLTLDLVIVLETIKTVIFGRGGR